MKVFCFSFIVYIVLLLTQPCQDFAATANDSVYNKSPYSQQQKPSNHNSQSDECSPFCICSCCSLSVVEHSVSFTLTSVLKSVEIKANLANYTNPNSETLQTSIWQPPKA